MPRRGEECRHNLLYWRYGEYAGIGPGAHGRVLMDGARHATLTEKLPERWLERVEAQEHGMLESTPLSKTEETDEALLMGLRLAEGLDLDDLEDIGGLRPGERAVDELARLGLIERQGASRLRATPAGRFVLNEIVLRLSSALEAQ